MVATTAEIPSEVYGIFSGPIDQGGAQRLINSLTTASANNVQHIHLMFQSLGGGIGEGICLHNLFQTLPFGLTLYNSGSVSSIAVIAYLGAKRRKVSAYASFMIHRTQTTTQAANTQTIKAFAESAVLFDKSTEAILRRHINMPEDKWAHFNHNDLWFSAEDAVKVGIADAVEEFSPPSGTRLFTL
jgi:ATP-dependent Clp protease, protease subunit